jgi:DNA-binding NarL/FixJ family response regulator
VAIRLVVADDHEVVRQGLCALLERAGFEVVGQAADGWDAVRLVREVGPDAAVLDVVMPVLNGVDAAREIARERPETKVILLTAHPAEPYILRALESGVRGFVVKTEAVDVLVQAIHDVLQGRVYLSEGVPQALVQAYLAGDAAGGNALTDRERQVLQMVAEGRSLKEIGQALGVNPKTAAAHRRRLMRKLGVRDAAGLVRHAIRLGLVEP